jgi:hypothetical protein
MNNKKTKYKVEYRPLESLKPFENNPRYIKEEDFERLCASVQNNPELFEAQPIILSDRTGELVIIAGNQRYRAAKEVGMKEVPTVLITGLTEQKEKEIIIRTNVTNGKWDYDRLANDDWSIEDLGDWGVDCFFLNIDEDDTDIDKLFEDAQNTESKAKDIKLSVHIPQELKDKVDEIKEIIKSSVSEYEGVEIK